MRILLIAIILPLLFVACSEQECCVLPEEPTLIGTWKLSKLCFSNGASSCNVEDMWDADTNEVLTFTEDGNFTFDIEGSICSGTYSMTEQEGVVIQDVNLIATGGDCSFDETIFWLSKLTIDEMILSPRCIEGCPHLYVRQQT